MHFTTILFALTTAIDASAAPANELQTRASNTKLARIAGKWQVGWQGATTAQQYTCSNNGLLNILNLNCVSVLNGATVAVPISLLGAGSLSSILSGLGLGGLTNPVGGVRTGTGTGTGSLTSAQCLLCSLCPPILSTV